MCEWGDTVKLTVPIPAEDSHTSEPRWAHKPIDRCIAPIVQALNNAGVYTRACCCGHGEQGGTILLHDGRIILIQDNENP